MLSLASLCSAVFRTIPCRKRNFTSVFQFKLDLPLNTKNVHNYVSKWLWKIGNFWGPDFFYRIFCSYLPDFYPHAR
jgi:hypothetical protein